MCRTTFYHNAAVLLSALMRCGVQCLDEFYSAVRGKVLQGGYSAVLHPHGRHGHYRIPIRISWPRVVALMARGSGGSIGMICPTRCCVANGSGTCCAWCARHQERRDQPVGEIGAARRIPTAW